MLRKKCQRCIRSGEIATLKVIILLIDGAYKSKKYCSNYNSNSY